jgi:aminoglycoside phosphotransferase family enzyme/predicted kinase
MTDTGLIEAMTRPDFYPNHPDTVELLQTHISFIFIAGEEVYKLKKAVDFGFLDFTTLEKRKFYYNEELRLNRRLAPDTYIEVLPISKDERGMFAFGEGKRIVEYAVRMKRLPAEKMLKVLLAKGLIKEDVMDDIAKKVAAFHKEAATGGRIDEIGGLETVRFNHKENFEQTLPYVGFTIPRRQFDFIRDYVHHFLFSHAGLFKQRVANHKIRDCHGDLHLEHIVVDNGITIFDCIEFNERLRFEDVAAEVAFLAMDLDYNGYPACGESFVHAYVRHADEPEVLQLLNFFKCYYAYVRGKVIGFRTRDDAISEPLQQEAARTAAGYFDLAYTYAARIEKPALIITAGLIGSGKSVLARSLANRLGAEIIQMDTLRKDLLGISPTERHLEDFGKGIYSSNISKNTYDEALRRAISLIQTGTSVIIDASFKKRTERLISAKAAQAAGVDFFIVECACPDRIIGERLKLRSADLNEPSDGRWDIFQAQKKDYETITEFQWDIHFVIDTEKKLEDSTDEALRLIRHINQVDQADVMC